MDINICSLSLAVTDLINKYDTLQIDLDEKFEAFRILLENLEPSSSDFCARHVTELFFSRYASHQFTTNT